LRRFGLIDFYKAMIWLERVVVLVGLGLWAGRFLLSGFATHG